MTKKSPIQVAFGNKMLLRRRELELTQEELALKCGLHLNYIGQCERGERNLGLESIVKIAKALDLKISDLMP